MELFDILDSEGQAIGQSKAREHVHASGDWHASVTIWVLNSRNEILLQKRAAEKDSFPDMWEISCSGHLSTGEGPETAALRELEEELGVTAQASELEHLFRCQESHVLNNGTFIDNEFKDVYLLKRDLDSSSLQLQSDEVSAIRWISIPALKTLIEKNDPTLVPHPEIYPQSLAHSMLKTAVIDL